MINVVAALIIKGDKILIAKRKTGDKCVVDKWEFPGGKVENNETDICAIKREIKEELGILIEVDKLLASTIYKYPTKEVNIILYKCIPENKKIKLVDHKEYKWICFSDVLKYDLAEADKELVKIINLRGGI